MAADVELDDLLDMAGCYFGAAMRQVDIEAFFSRHDVPLAEGSSKKTYAKNTLASLPQKKALELILAFAKEKQEIALQDCVYQLQDKATPEITKITRLRVADLLGTGIHGQGVDPDAITAMFDLKPHSFDFIYTGRTKIDELWQYATGPDPEWNAKVVFEFVGAMNCPSQRFLELLETTLDPIYRASEEQVKLAEDLSRILHHDGYEVTQTGDISGRATYSVVPVRRGVDGRPKNLIFASIGQKPRLGFSDAIDNEIVVLEHADSCLIYDRPICDGLSWIDLVQWWKEKEGITALDDARTNLGKRLFASLANAPEKEFFSAYFRHFREPLGDLLPALIPQVYLHYDPEIVSRLADRQVLVRQRMDFLMLLPGRQRIVLEIDGKQHYAENCANVWHANPRRYAEMVTADRDLRLRGYEVFRFGGSEFDHPKEKRKEAIKKLVSSFFEQLFTVHRIE